MAALHARQSDKRIGFAGIHIYYRRIIRLQILLRKKITIKQTENQKINSNSNIIKITKNNVKPIKKINHEFRNEHQNIASQPSKTVENSTEILENPAEEYSADYVIVNGKKIYNEEEAIDITKEAFQLFASNVTKTINQAEPIKNLSINF